MDAATGLIIENILGNSHLNRGLQDVIAAYTLIQEYQPVEIDGKRVYALIIKPEGLHVEFRDVVPNTADAVVEQYGVGNVYVPMNSGQWWVVGYKYPNTPAGWYNIALKDLPKEIQLWLTLME